MPVPVVIIPAYQPGEQLFSLVQQLVEDHGRRIVVIDDGSADGCQYVFTNCQRYGQVKVIAHGQNRGKGAALRTGFRFVLKTMGDCSAAVTADADGQHHPTDIDTLCREAEKRPGVVILGARSFAGEVPWRSRFGNTLTRSLFRLLFASRLGDTQTGLRAIPVDLLPELLQLQSERYSFELEMLISFIRKQIPILEIPIATIYEEGNQTSHFRPFRDSLAIYTTLARMWLLKR